MLLYRVLAASALLAYSPIALLRALTGRRRLGDLRGRLGRLPYPDLDGGIWAHAVSVGEVGVATTLLRTLSQRAPGLRLGLSVTTEAGRELAERRVGRELPVFAFPFDLGGPVEKALVGVRPGLILLTETELWPLFLERAARRGVPVAVVNGRISERSYGRYRRLRPWFARSLEHVSLFVMQSDEDARRLAGLGVSRAKIRMEGNVKYDLPAPAPFRDAERILLAAGSRPILVAASTAEGEEEAVLAAWKTLEPRPLLAIAPRRPERFDEVARKAEASGLRVIRRSVPTPTPTPPPARATAGRPSAEDVYLLDSIGELSSLYAAAAEAPGGALAFVGGSLVARGGHNPIEAWAAGVPVVVGPHTHNFREVTATGEALGILRRVADGAALGPRLAKDLADRGSLEARGAAARKLVAGSRGAADATADAVLALLPPAPARRGAVR